MILLLHGRIIKSLDQMNHKDILHEIFKFLELKSVIRCSIVSKLFKKISDMQYLRLMNNDYDNILIEFLIENSDKQSYITCYELNIFSKNISASMTNIFFVNRMENSRTLIFKIPQSIGQLRNLQNLVLTSNRITKIPKSIGQLYKLREINLANNQIAKIPKSMSQLSNLRTLILSNNKITKISEAICQLSNLRELWLDFNQITSVPDSITNLWSLQRLHLDNNKMVSRAASIDKLQNLRIFTG
jgi:Leucine-rich repeat (LRR) protein